MVNRPGTTGDVRAEVENLLGTYAMRCDRRDISGLAELLRKAVLKFGDAEPVTGPGAIAELFRHAFASGDVTRHLISNTVSTEPSPGVVTGRVSYTRWILEPEPTLAGMGQYLSEFTADGADWAFAAHTVRRDWVRESKA